ncbi:hypothetical protein MVLG_02341 [Microbotryum lychnidis-dioicae p1A1 Lamole]|uniref:Eukaryotic translation initiation factor 3 subunit K n=1 Tax=Microbotryum lychnidis-dioicae (strain p1A1 Lamole / MvSl-1064) TaxID=683840 RepID=U5H4V6_USTV1|nr:hypothetical protein MVLG_02341 [Microbotryum lychnidis-dioicae p1A1 Lamole]|eukprot:KDE07477.1 hypothetical protein MVLG_02341 [Microbotryum lychnidis-dioicae p1A1 Lamole]
MTLEVVPPSRPSHIATLINGVDRYNPSNCHLLEEYVQQQLSNSSYDLLSNLALLKLYQFNPSLLSPSATLSILFLCLVHRPFDPDFSLAWSLLGDSFVVGASLPPAPLDSDDEEDELPKAAAPQGEREAAYRFKLLSQYLQARRFKLFWSSIGGNLTEGDKAIEVNKILGEMKEAAEGWERVTREQIAIELEQSFRGLDQKTTQVFLGLQDGSDELKAIKEQRGWTDQGKDLKFPKNDGNSPTSTVTNEKITIDQLSRLLGRTQA